MAASQAHGSSVGETSRQFFTPQLLGSLIGLALIGQSLTQFFAYQSVPPAQRLTYFTQNALPTLLPPLALPTFTGFLPLLTALTLLIVARERAAALVESFTRIIAPAGLAVFLPALFTWQLGQQRPIG